MEDITPEDIQNLQEFEKRDLDLKILSQNQVIFQSDERGIGAVVNFLRNPGNYLKDLVIYDRIVGQAVALLFVYLSDEFSGKGGKIKKVLGVTGSEKAKEVFEKYEIPFHFLKTVPYITNRDQTGPCPFEELSEGKTPQEFWKIASGRC